MYFNNKKFCPILALNCPDHPGSGLSKDHSTYTYVISKVLHTALARPV